MRRLFQLQSRRATPKQVNNGKRVLVWFRIFARNLEPDDLGWVNPMNRNILGSICRMESLTRNFKPEHLVEWKAPLHFIDITKAPYLNSIQTIRHDDVLLVWFSGGQLASSADGTCRWKWRELFSWWKTVAMYGESATQKQQGELTLKQAVAATKFRLLSSLHC